MTENSDIQHEGDQGRNRSTSLRRALTLLDAVATATRAGEELTLTRLSERLGMNRSTVLRLLQPLLDLRLIEQFRPGGKYQLGPYAIRLGQSYLDRLDVRQSAASSLQTLKEKSQETIHLGIFESDEVVYVDKVESPQPVRMVSQIGARQPLYCTAMGKAFLAHATPEYLEEVVARGFARRTDNTITTSEKLHVVLQEIRERGYAIDDIENEPDIRCIAAPIFNHHGLVAAMLSISGPATRMTLERLQNLAPAILSSAADISRSMGYYNDKSHLTPDNASFITGGSYVSDRGLICQSP